MRRSAFLPLLVLWTQLAVGESAKGTWDSQFTLPPGLNGYVYAMASLGNDLYVGGLFTEVGSNAISGVVKWDGTNWSGLGTGVSGPVYALEANGTNLYVGGQFDSAGGVAATNVAKWNGVAWEALGGGVDQGGLYAVPVVFALYVQGGDLFVGGQFQMAGGIAAVNVARWDGSAWHAMDTGAFLPDDPDPWGAVLALTGDGTNVYVGGIFIQAGSIAATNLARWDGSAWEAIGDCTGGLPNVTYQGYERYGSVSALATHQGALFVGGGFGFVGRMPAQGLARWDGATWQNVGAITGEVNALESYAESLYVAGNFVMTGGIETTNAAVWTTGTWSALNAQVQAGESINSLHHRGTELCLGGFFRWVQGVNASSVARRVGTNWSALGIGTGNSPSGKVSALATDGTNVYATGSFATAGSNTVSGLARWDGTNWSSMGNFPTQATGSAILGNALAVVGSNVYLGAVFAIPEGSATNLACWNGVVWASPGGPLTNVSISGLLAVGNKLYVSGSFVDASGSAFGPVAGWDGTNWSNVPWNLGTKGDLMATDQTNLFIAKNMDDNHGSSRVQVAQWDGATLSPRGYELFGLRASALAAHGTNLYLAGSSRPSFVQGLFSWDGNSWQAMVAPLPSWGFINAILPLRGNLYVAGSFQSVSGTTANSIAKWTGSSWLSLDSGVTGITPGNGTYVSGLVALGRKVFVGGQFISAGGSDSGDFAVWNEAPEIRLDNPRKEPTGEFAFELSGVPGEQVQIEASSTLSDWMTVSTINLESEAQAFSDLPPTNVTSRFYRAKFLK